MLPEPDALNDFPYGKFVLSNLAAKRAKDLKKSAIPLVNIKSKHPLTIALAEIAAGKITPIMPEIGSNIIEVDGDIEYLVEGRIASGRPLPGLEDHEVDLFGMDDEDAEHDNEDDDGVLSISSLVSDDDDVEVVESDENHLSLTDLETEEAAEEEESGD